MLRDLRGLDINLYQQADYNEHIRNPLYRIYAGENEEIPILEKRWRELRMVHFDIDPKNSPYTACLFLSNGRG